MLPSLLRLLGTMDDSARLASPARVVLHWLQLHIIIIIIYLLINNLGLQIEKFRLLLELTFRVLGFMSTPLCSL